MKKRYLHTTPGPMTLDLTLSAGLVEVITEDREHAEITLEPVHPGDQIADDLIDRSTHASHGSTFRVDVPRPEGTAISGSGVTHHIGGGTVIVNSSDAHIVNSRVVCGNSVTHVSTGGAIKAVARLPYGSSVKAATTSADVSAETPLHRVGFTSTSGDLDIEAAVSVQAHTVSGDLHIASANTVRANSTSGDLKAGELAVVGVRTVSGDVDVRRLVGTEATLNSTSGDITLHAEAQAQVTAHSVSGDIRITTAPGVEVRTSTSTVSGRVRTPNH